MRKLPIALSLLAFAGFAKAEPQSTYDAVVAGTVCTPQTNGDVMECNYRVGESLHITIAGVGVLTAGVSFPRSDDSGDYYGGFGVMHGCIDVTPGNVNPRVSLDMAFIAPLTGTVHRSWQACSEDNRAKANELIEVMTQR